MPCFYLKGCCLIRKFTAESVDICIYSYSKDNMAYAIEFGSHFSKDSANFFPVYHNVIGPFHLYVKSIPVFHSIYQCGGRYLGYLWSFLGRYLRFEQKRHPYSLSRRRCPFASKPSPSCLLFFTYKQCSFRQLIRTVFYVVICRPYRFKANDILPQ